MAISANSVWEVRSTATGGANVNGGFFVTGASGVDYSQQNGAQYALTGGSTAGADAILLHANAAADMVGNGLKIVSGTNATVGWYEVISVVVGVSITLDRNITTGAGASIVANVGGAISLGSSDDAVFESLVAGNTMWVKDGDYTINGTVTISAAGGSQNPIKVRGYNAARGDNPMGSTRPNFDCGAVTMTFGANWDVSNIIFTGSAANVVAAGASNKFLTCKFTNTSTTAGRNALIGGANSLVSRCELISYRGMALRSTASIMVRHCYIHSSDLGISQGSTANPVFILGNLITGCVTAAISLSAANTTHVQIIGNTLVGAPSKLGIGVNIATGLTNISILNNIIYGFVTGVAHADVQSVGQDDFNCFNNNTTNGSNWTLGGNSITTAPGFTSLAEVTGTTATTGASGVLTDAAANFSAVVDNQDFIYVSAGTGVTAGYYLITAHTATTVTTSPNIAADATADKVYKVLTGRNYAVGTNMQAVGTPGLFAGGLTTAYVDIGAIQRKERASTDPGVGNVANGTNYTINDAPLTGTLVTSTGSKAVSVGPRRGGGIFL